MITFCPKCGTKLGADESMVGQQVQCGKCSNRFTVLPTDLPEAAAPAEEKFPEAPAPPTTPFRDEKAADETAEPGPAPAAETEAAPPPAPPGPPAPRPKPAIKKAEPTGESDKCPKCGADLAPNAVLCTKCGTFLKDAEGGPKKKSSLMPLLIGGAVLCVVGAGGWFWWNSRQSSEAETPPPPPVRNAQAPSAPSGVAPTPAPRAVTPGAVELTALTPQQIEAVSKLPAQDPPLSAEETAEAAKRSPLLPRATLRDTLSLKGPEHDRYQPDKPPQLAANTRCITLHLQIRQTDTDPPLLLNAETLRVTSDAGPGVLYGVEFTNILSAAWMPRSASGNSSTILESARYATRRVGELTTEKLASADLLARPAYSNWFERVITAIPGDTLRVVSALNQFLNNNRVESESGIFFALNPDMDVHLVVPAAARVVRLQFADTPPMTFPLEAMASIPTTSQPDPVPFIHATIEKARVFLASNETGDVTAGGQLLIEAGNLDLQNKLKPTAFQGWVNTVTQLFTRADAAARMAGVDAILRSQHVDPKARGALFLAATHDSLPATRRRAAELIDGKPSLMDAAYKDAMEGLQSLLVDSNFTVRAAAHVSNCRIAVQGDDNTFEGQEEYIQKGLLDPAPSVRLALLGSILPMQTTDAKQTLSRLAKLLPFVRLNLFDSNESARALAARTLVGLRSPVSAAVVADALRQFPDKVAPLFAQAAIDLPLGSAGDLTNRVPALADKQTQALLLPALARMLDDPKPATRQAAARVIGVFQHEVADAALTTAATNSDLGTRMIAFSSLNAPDRAALPPVPVFADGLNDPDVRIRGAAFQMLDLTLDQPAVVANVTSNIEARAASAAVRAPVAQKFGLVAVSNAPVLLAMTSFLADKNDNVWRAAITPWAKTKMRFPWKEIEPVWNLVVQPSNGARRSAAFYPLYLAAQEPIGATTNTPPEAVEEASKLLADPDATMRDAALLFVVPHRRAADTEPIRKILTDPKVEFTAQVRNRLLRDLAQPSTTETLEVVDHIRPATEEDKKHEREALNAAATASPQKPSGTPRPPLPGPNGPGGVLPPPGMAMPPGGPMPPKTPASPPPATPSAGPSRVTFLQTNYRVMRPVTSPTGMYLLTQWATSQNPSAGAVAGYLMQLVQPLYGRSWILPSERQCVAQALQKLSSVPATAAAAKLALSTFEARFPFGVAAKSLAPEQTQGVADSVDSLAAFVGPKKKPVVIATYKAPSGNLVDIWFSADETVPPTYPADAAKDGGTVWKFVSKLDGSRMDPINRDVLARLEWAVANAPKDKTREALLRVAKAEGEEAPLARAIAMEGLVLLGSQGDTAAEAEAMKLGWLKP